MFNFGNPTSLIASMQDIFLYQSNDHFTLLEPFDSETTIDTLLSNDINKNMELVEIYPNRISPSVYEISELVQNVALVKENDSTTLEEKSDETTECFKNKANNGKNVPHLYMMSTFSHLLYNIKTIFAREISGKIYPFV